VVVQIFPGILEKSVSEINMHYTVVEKMGRAGNYFLVDYIQVQKSYARGRYLLSRNLLASLQT
jgi:hypothetical protein